MVAVKVHAGFFAQPHLVSGLLWWRGREGSMVTSKSSVMETKVAHRFGSKASLALEGRMVPSHERASNKGRWPWSCQSLFLQDVHLYSRLDSGTVACAFETGELSLLLKTCASVVLT